MHDKCINCKFFIQHYSIDKNLYITKVNCGHCIANLGLKTKKDCSKFEQNLNAPKNQFYFLANYLNKLNNTIESLQNDLHKLMLDFNNFSAD